MASFHQVLIILLGSMFFAGGSGDNLIEQIEDAVPEGARRASAVLVVERMEEHSRSEVERFVDWHKSFYELVGSEAHTEDDIRASVDGLIDGVNRFDEQSIDLIFELRGVLDEEEWEEVFGD